MLNIFSSGVNTCLFFIQVRFPDGIIFFLFNVYFIFLATLRLCCCMDFSLVVTSSWSCSLAVVGRLPMAGASLVARGSPPVARGSGYAGFSAYDSQAPEHRRSSCEWA